MPPDPSPAAGNSAPPAAAAAPSRLPRTFRAFTSRNYRLFFAGQSISLIGTWLSRLAATWLVFRLTHSPLLLGVVGFAGQIPTLIVSPWAGVFVDHHSRHRVLIVTQVAAMLQSFALAALALTGVVQIWHIIVLSAVQGVINAFDMPARQAFLTEMVPDRSMLPNAIALNSSMVNATRLIGPAIGGVLVGLAGEGLCFLIDGFSYIAVVFSLTQMHVTERPRPPAEARSGSPIREGFRYALEYRPIRAILSMLAIVSLCGVPYTVLMPAVASDILHGGPNTLGLLMGASGIGALCSALYLASRTTVIGLVKQNIGATGVFGLALIAFSFSTSIILSALLLFFVGAAMMLQMAASNTVLQTLVEEGKRGRIMSLFGMAFFGSVPIGSLIAGGLANVIGTMHTIAFGGVICIIACIWFTMQYSDIRARIRPRYAELGIIPPEITSAVSQATEVIRLENE